MSLNGEVESREDGEENCHRSLVLDRSALRADILLHNLVDDLANVCEKCFRSFHVEGYVHTLSGGLREASKVVLLDRLLHVEGGSRAYFQQE